jgi:hypothetical protein
MRRSTIGAPDRYIRVGVRRNDEQKWIAAYATMTNFLSVAAF